TSAPGGNHLTEPRSQCRGSVSRSLPRTFRMTMTERLERLHHILERTRQETRKVILGQDSVIDQALIVILARQHCLIEGVPGIAKPLLARTLGRVLGCPFARIQFTPDLMPADVTGTNIFHLGRNEFTLVNGPIFTSFLLADEINRAPAKTQSAL